MYKNPNSINAVYVGFNDMSIHNLLWGILELGLNCRAFDLAHCNSDSDIDCEILRSFIKEAPTDIVFSQNFSPAVSIVSNELSIPYAAWTYDMPLSSLHHSSIFNESNYIFAFDKYQKEFLLKKGVKHVYHLPLAANTSRSTMINITSEDELKYSCDVSFVGNVQHKGWTDHYNDYKNLMNEIEVDLLNTIENNTYAVWDGKNKIHELFTPKLLEAFKRLSKTKPEIDEQVFYETVIAYHISFIERKKMLQSLMYFGINHYSQTGITDIEGLKTMPALSYDDELPKVYFLSKINMSSTLRSIPSGIPLRVFDILGMCSFCLTNYQPELEELFDIGNEIAVYRTLDEIPSIVDYYLHHDTERLRIAVNGYRKVSSCYTWANGIEKILDIIL